MDVKKKALVMMIKMLIEVQDIEDKVDLLAVYSLTKWEKCKEMHNFHKILFC